MKLIGKNSISTFISYVLFAGFLFFSYTFIIEFSAFVISFANLRTGSTFLNETFYVWKEGASQTAFFKFHYPFTNQQLAFGRLDLYTAIKYLSGMLFLVLSFFFGYKIFRSMGTEKLFNSSVIMWLKRFSILNTFYAFFFPVLLYFTFGKVIVESIVSALALLALGIMVYFIVEFFKKGYEIQSENDLTI